MKKMLSVVIILVASVSICLAQSNQIPSKESTMQNQPAPVYAIIEVKIKNPPRFMEYVKGHMPSVFQYGGKFVAE